MDITIPDCVTRIKDCAFYACENLTNIIIPDGVSEIGNFAFSHCPYLTNITIPNSVIVIGESIFSRCPRLTTFYGKFASDDNRCLIANGKLVAFATFGLTEYTIPTGINSIGNWVFEYCYGITNISIPYSVTVIGENVFIDCGRLTKIYCQPTAPPTLKLNALYGISSSAKIYVPMTSVDAYKSAAGWSDYASMIVGYDF